MSQAYVGGYFDFSLCVWNTFGNVADQVTVLKELAFVTSKSIFVTVFKKGTVEDRLDFYKHVGVEVIDVDRETETYQLKGYTSRTFDIEDIEQYANRAGLRVVDSKVLGGVILWVELSK